MYVVRKAVAMPLSVLNATTATTVSEAIGEAMALAEMKTATGVMVMDMVVGKKVIATTVVSMIPVEVVR